MKKLILAGLLAFLFASCSDKVVADGVLDLKGANARDIKVHLSGEKRIKDFVIKGLDKPSIVVYWATYCDYCIAEIPHLVNLQQKYKDKIKIMGFSVENKPKQDFLDFIRYHNINYDIFYGKEVYELADSMGGVRGIPAIFMFDKNGVFHKNFLGLLPPEILESEIKTLLEAKS